MGTLIVDLLIITAIVCYVVDVSGFVPSIKRMYLRKVFGVHNPNITSINWKPFDCSLCMTLWVGLFYLLVMGQITLINIGIVFFFSLISSNVSGFLWLVKDYLSALENWLQKLIKQ